MSITDTLLMHYNNILLPIAFASDKSAEEIITEIKESRKFRNYLLIINEKSILDKVLVVKPKL